MKGKACVPRLNEMKLVLNLSQAHLRSGIGRDCKRTRDIYYTYFCATAILSAITPPQVSNPPLFRKKKKLDALRSADVLRLCVRERRLKLHIPQLIGFNKKSELMSRPGISIL